MSAASPRLAPRVTAVRLTDFRNYAGLALRCDAGLVALAGDNGAGKTNFLEALSFLSPGRGLRRAEYEAVARVGGPGSWAVSIDLLGALGPARIGTGFEPATGDGQRRIRIDGAPAKGAEALLDHLRIGWLTPAMDGLFTGPPAERRRFLDRLVLALDPAHGARVAAYERAMRGRNRLLGDGPADAGWLAAIEAQMAELGVAVAAARRDLVGALAAAITAGHDPASPFPDAVVGLEGEVDADLAAMSALDAEDRLRRALAGSRVRDRAAGRALAGPHRSDFVVVHGPKSVPAAMASTGEQKALLIGLVLAHARLVGEVAGIVPVLLLDEVAAHLDPARRAGLFAALARLGGQAFLTGTDHALFEGLGADARVFTVTGGRVREG